MNTGTKEVEMGWVEGAEKLVTHTGVQEKAVSRTSLMMGKEPPDAMLVRYVREMLD